MPGCSVRRLITDEVLDTTEGYFQGKPFFLRKKITTFALDAFGASSINLK